MYKQLMFNGTHKRDVGGIFPSATGPGPVFKAPIPYEEIKALATKADLERLRSMLNGRPAGAPAAPKPS
jgi:hypothetical protein